MECVARLIVHWQYLMKSQALNWNAVIQPSHHQFAARFFTLRWRHCVGTCICLLVDSCENDSLHKLCFFSEMSGKFATCLLIGVGEWKLEVIHLLALATEQEIHGSS